ncbi:hypothetical protein [Arthrobacter woluwensis]
MLAREQLRPLPDVGRGLSCHFAEPGSGARGRTRTSRRPTPRGPR